VISKKKIELESAKHEHAWTGHGQTPGLMIWTIDHFHVKPWDLHNYGSFYSGDSYIILNTYKDKDSDTLHYDIHHWIGQSSTQDEYGTAAYKAVELDNFLGRRAHIHREVEGLEGKKFRTYFPHGIFTLEGGNDSGFFHNPDDSWETRLLRVKGILRHLHTRQVPLSYESLCEKDVFILDLGHKVFQWNGVHSTGTERNKAAQVVEHLKEKRLRHIDLVVIDQGEPTDDDEDFWNQLGGRGEIKTEDPDSDIIEKKKTEMKLLKLVDRSGEFSFNLISEGHHNIKPELFHSDDVYLLDEGNEVYIWIGEHASPDEKHRGVVWAQKYIETHHNNIPIPITVIPEGGDQSVLPKLLNEII